MPSSVLDLNRGANSFSVEVAGVDCWSSAPPRALSLPTCPCQYLLLLLTVSRAHCLACRCSVALPAPQPLWMDGVHISLSLGCPSKAPWAVQPGVQKCTSHSSEAQAWNQGGAALVPRVDIDSFYCVPAASSGGRWNLAPIEIGTVILSQ